MDNMVEKKIVAIIPARGGSKRIPKKNIIDFEGKPMIAWTIEEAKKTKIFSDIVISTDDKEIAQTCKEYGAKVPFMREKYADDQSPVSLAVYETLEKLGFRYDIVVMLMPNCPLRKAREIKLSLLNFIRNNNKFQISSFRYGWMNPWWAHRIDKNTQRASPLYRKEIKMRSQDLEELHCPTGAIWIAEVEEFKKSKTFYGDDYTMFDIDWKAAVDIDDFDDLDFARAVAKLG